MFSLFRDSSLSIASQRSVFSELDLVLVINADHVRSNINEIFVNNNLLAVNSNSGLMNRLSNLIFVNQGLKSSLQDSLDVKTQNVIKSVLSFFVE